MKRPLTGTSAKLINSLLQSTMNQTWRITNEPEWEAPKVERREQAAHCAGRHAARCRGLRFLPARGRQSSALLQVEEAALGVGQSRLRGTRLEAKRPGPSTR